jgi:hypothetical protein
LLKEKLQRFLTTEAVRVIRERYKSMWWTTRKIVSVEVGFDYESFEANQGDSFGFPV